MAKERHYSPAIDRFLVTAIYFEAKHQGIPMTRLVDKLLKPMLEERIGWQQAREWWSENDRRIN